MEADLHAIVRFGSSETADRLTDAHRRSQIRSGQPLSDAHFQSFIYQTLCGLKVSHLGVDRLAPSDDLIAPFTFTVHPLGPRSAP